MRGNDFEFSSFLWCFEKSSQASTYIMLYARYSKSWLDMKKTCTTCTKYY